MKLPRPENVHAAVQMFNQDNEEIEQALQLLVQQFPHNQDLRHVLLKAVAVNALYSTQIPVYTHTVVNIVDVAHFIQTKNVDTRLAMGDPVLVNELSFVSADAKKERNCFSFATKYCCWHNPNAFPIWDTNVYKYLRQLQKTDGFRPEFRLNGNWKYSEFVDFMNALRRKYKLEGVAFKDLDKFLYSEGAALQTRAAEA